MHASHGMAQNRKQDHDHMKWWRQLQQLVVAAAAAASSIGGVSGCTRCAIVSGGAESVGQDNSILVHCQ